MAEDLKIFYEDQNLIAPVTLKQAQTQADLIHLQDHHLQAIKSLHDLVHASLPPEEKSFILPRSLEYFQRHFTRGFGSTMIGIVHENILVAKSVILHPEENCAPDELGGAILSTKPESTSILQAATVHPDYQGNGLMQAMVQHWMAYAQSQNKTHAMAEIEVRNHKSWSTFLKIGLNIVRVGKSPVDGADVYSAQERIKYGMTKELNPGTYLSDHDVIECDALDIDQQKSLLDNGYKVIGHDRAQGHLILKKMN